MSEIGMIGFQSPNAIVLSGDVLALLQQVDENLERVASLRPFTAEVDQRIRNAFLPDRVTATLNIEGIAVSRRQTLAIMDALVVSQQVVKEDQEIANALRADEFVYDAYENKVDFDLGFVRHINALILEGVNDTGGQIRTSDVTITGADFTPPSPASILPLLQEVQRTEADAVLVHPVVHASWLHHQIAFVHPFLDGNGRTARLVQDFVLLKRGLFPVGVPSSQRDMYYQALQRADGGKWDDLVSLIAQNELSTLGKIESIATETAVRAKWITRLAAIANDRKTGVLYKQYVVWKTRMEQLRDAFCRASAELDQSTHVIGATERWYDVIDLDDWKKISTTGRRPAFTWLFSLLFFIDGEPFYKLIAFVARHKPDPLDFSADLKEAVSLQFTGIPAKSEERPNFLSFDDQDIRLREIMFFKDDLHAAYEVNGARSYIDNKTSEEIIQDVFEDVFYKKGGLSG